MNLPPKKEYVLYAPLSMRQREAYDRVLDGGLRQWLIHGGTGGVVIDDNKAIEEEDNEDAIEVDEDDEKEEDSESRRVSKRFIKGGRKSYVVDGDDDEDFDTLNNGDLEELGVKVIKTKEEEEAEEARIGREYQIRTKGQLLLPTKLPSLISMYSQTSEQYEAAKPYCAAT